MSNAYRVNDSTELDDLVIWAKQSCSNTYLKSPAFRNELRCFLEQTTTTEYFAGPLDCQAKFDPAEVVPASSPIIIHILLGLDVAFKSFLYLTESTTEFHLPENFVITGDLKEDKRRLALIRGLADGLQRLTELDWELAEYGGMTIAIENYDDFWGKYWENALGRVDHELIGRQD